MAGLGRHSSATENKVVPDHCQGTALSFLLGRRCPLQPRLCRQKAVCEREGVPFQRTANLAVTENERLQPLSDTHTHGLVDSRYHRRRVRQAAVRRGWDISGGLKSNRLIRISAAEGKPQRVPLRTDAAGLNTTDRIEDT